MGDSLGVSSVTDPERSRLGGETLLEVLSPLWGSSLLGDGSGDGSCT